MRIAWDMQAQTGPRPTGLGVSARLLYEAALAHCGCAITPLRPNETDSPLATVRDRLLWEQWRLPRAVRRVMQVGTDAATNAMSPEPLRLLYSPALGAPLRCNVPTAAHVHDVIGLRFPQQFSGAGKWYWTRLLPATWRRCGALTVSNSWLVGEVSEVIDYPPERIHVVPYYADPELLRIAVALRSHATQGADTDGSMPGDTQYFLMLGAHEPRKNFELGIQALALCRARGERYELVVGGPTTPHTDKLRELAARLSVADAVRFPDYAARDETVRLLLGATALLFVSRYEGYGMPPQEAQALGVPVVLSDIPCHRTVYLDPGELSAAGLTAHDAPPLVAVDDAQALAEFMLSLAGSATLRARLGEAGMRYQRRFTAERTARAEAAAWSAAAGR